MAMLLKILALLLLSVALSSSSAALDGTTALITRDCTQANGGWECVTHEQAASIPDTKTAEAALVNGLQADLTVRKRDDPVNNSVADDTTLECDSKSAPISKSDVKFAFITKFCTCIDDVMLRQSSIDENPVELNVRMYLYVGTQTADWIYALDQDLCINTFMHIINKCTVFTELKGGKWFTEHLMYEIRVVQVGPPLSSATASATVPPGA